MLGFNSISEESLSTLPQESITNIIDVDRDLPFDIPTYYLVSPKLLCWIVENCTDPEWLVDHNKISWTLEENSC